MAPRLQASATLVSYVPEVTEGTTPANPAFKRARMTSEKFIVKRETARSNELTPNRNVRDLVVVSAEASGGFDFELSYGAFDDLLESALWSTWAANVMSNGVTPKPKTFEVKYEGAGADDIFKRFTGVHIGEFNIEIKPGEMITGSMTVLGRSSSYVDTAIAGATYTSAGDEVVWTASEFGSLTLGSLTIDCLAKLSLNINNNLRAQRCIGSPHPSGVGYGDFEVTGDIEMYLSHDQLPTLQAYIGNTTLDLSFVLGTTTLKKYLFEAKIKLSDLEVAAEGNNQDVMIKAKYQAIENTVAGTTLKITRAVV